VCVCVSVCFVGSHGPPQRDIAFMLAVRPSKVRAALMWQKVHSDENLQSFEDQVSDNVSRLFCDNTECVYRTTEDKIETNHYV
jgi:hypothetical protein